MFNFTPQKYDLSKQYHMPLLHEIPFDFPSPTAVWHIVEESQSLEKEISLNVQQQALFNGRQTETARQGFLAARAALFSLGSFSSQLQHCEQGAPVLPKMHCSMSHCSNFALAAIANQPIGVDIEAYRPKIKRIAPKFVHQHEETFLSPHPSIEMLTRLWTAKEAVYKALRQQGLSFKDQIQVMPFSSDDLTGEAKVHVSGKEKTIALRFNRYNHHEITHALIV